jgi:hypothetical protein
MQAAFALGLRRATSLLALVLSALLAGCASSNIHWAGRVGTYTFDQAVLELGPPDRSAPLTDGTVVADWVTRYGYMRPYSSYGFHYPDSYPGNFGMTYLETSPDYILRLTFGPDKKLESWKNLIR